MVRVSDLSKRYGRLLAVEGLSFELRPGEVAGLLGPNGAGKTTTIRAITGYHRPDRGLVSVCGHDTVRQAMAARRSLGYLPENAPLYLEMTPAGYLHHRGRLFGMRRPERRAAIDRVMEMCRIRDVRRRRVGQLSKGYRQRVGLAAALLHDPPVLVLDEPTNGLDPTQIRQTRALVRELAESAPRGRSERRTVLVSSHILAEIERTCDRVLILARGRLRADGAPERLLDEHAGAGVTLEARGDAREIEGAGEEIARLPGAGRVEREACGDGWWRLRVACERGGAGSGAELAERVGALAAARGMAVRELARRRPTLEDLFVRLIEDEAEGRTAGAPEPRAGSGAGQEVAGG